MSKRNTKQTVKEVSIFIYFSYKPTAPHYEDIHINMELRKLGHLTPKILYYLLYFIRLGFIFN